MVSFRKKVKDSPDGKEFDTYKVGTVANSTSTMHTIHKSPITINNFEIGDYNSNLSLIDDVPIGLRVSCFIDNLEQLRQLYLHYTEAAKEENDTIKKKEYLDLAKKYWKELIRWTPNSWLQTRTITMNYENLLSICAQRHGHKLKEWSESFINFVSQLPYAQELIFTNLTL